MNGGKDAETPGARTPEDKRDIMDGTRRLGCFGGYGQSSRDDQDTASHPNCQRRSDQGKDFDKPNPERNFGKILSQLREIEQSHLAYVGSHKKRLETRLNDAEEHERKFVSQVEAVEKQILDLMESLQQ